ncbi:MAG: CDP-alcohol phosphatidyltransferase family protein [Lachnospiraceae bacterium]|nr:CDP-alcohol phosphatidyltransferase family protein [Lachnospiraceae bacterium]
MKEKITVPNCITVLRIIGTVGLLFTEPLSVSFFWIYTLCGLTDVLDGIIARATKSTSELGAKLDSIADLTFYTVMLIRIFPILWERLPIDVWYMVGAILVIRLIAYLVAAVKHKTFSSSHTYLNKCTGGMVFAVPYFINRSFAVGFCRAVCIVAIIASLEELIIHLRRAKGDYHSDTKSVVRM